jgi:hypothetical protein
MKRNKKVTKDLIKEEKVGKNYPQKSSEDIYIE